MMNAGWLLDNAPKGRWKHKNIDGKTSKYQCQNCLEFGHYTYECTKDQKYLYRPSRTMVYHNPELADDVKELKMPKYKAIADDKKRSRYTEKEESEDSDAEGSQEISDGDDSSSSDSDSNSSSNSNSDSSKSKKNSDDSSSVSISTVSSVSSSEEPQKKV